MNSVELKNLMKQGMSVCKRTDIMLKEPDLQGLTELSEISRKKIKKELLSLIENMQGSEGHLIRYLATSTSEVYQHQALRVILALGQTQKNVADKIKELRV